MSDAEAKDMVLKATANVNKEVSLDLIALFSSIVEARNIREANEIVKAFVKVLEKDVNDYISQIQIITVMTRSSN